MKKIGNDEPNYSFIKFYKIDKEEQTIYMWHADGEVYLAPYTEENVRKLNTKMDKQARHNSIKTRTKFQEKYDHVVAFIAGFAIYRALRYRDKTDTALFCVAGLLTAENVISRIRYYKKKDLIDKYNYFLQHKDQFNRLVLNYAEAIKQGLSKKAIKEIDSKISEEQLPFTFNSVEQYTIKDLEQILENINGIEELQNKDAKVKTRGRRNHK